MTRKSNNLCYQHVLYCRSPTCAVLCSAVSASCQKLVVRGTEVDASKAEAMNKPHTKHMLLRLYQPYWWKI